MTTARLRNTAVSVLAVLLAWMCCGPRICAGASRPQDSLEIVDCVDLEGNPVLLVRSHEPLATVLHVGVGSPGRTAAPATATWHVPISLKPERVSVIAVGRLDGIEMLPETMLSVAVGDALTPRLCSFDSRAMAILEEPGAVGLDLTSEGGLALIPVTGADLNMAAVDCPYVAVAIRVSRVGELPPERLAWLEQYAFQGGHLFLVDDSAGDVPTLPAPFAQCLPAGMQATRLPADDTIEALTGIPFASESQVFLRPPPTEAEVRTTAPLSCTPHGFGQFTYVGLDALSPAVLSWSGAGRLWDSLYRGSRGRVLGYAGSRQVADWVLVESLRESRESRASGGGYRRIVSHPTVTFGLGILLLFGVLHFGACYLYRSGRVPALKFLLLAWAGSVLVSVLMVLAQEFRGAVPFTFRALDVRYLFPDAGRSIDVSGISVRSRFRALLSRSWRRVPERVRMRAKWSGMSPPVRGDGMLVLRMNAFEHVILSTFESSVASAGLSGEVVLDARDWSVDVRLHNGLDEAVQEGVVVMSRLSSGAVRGESVCAASLGPLSPESDLEFEGLPSWPISEASSRLREPTALLAGRHSRSVYYGAQSQGRPVCLYIGLLSTWEPNLKLEPGDALRSGNGLIVQELPLRIREGRDRSEPFFELARRDSRGVSVGAGNDDAPAQSMTLAASALGDRLPLWYDGAAAPLPEGTAGELRFDAAWHVRETWSAGTWPVSDSEGAPAVPAGHSPPALVVRVFDLSSRMWRTVWRDSYESLESLSTEALRQRVSDIRSSLAGEERFWRERAPASTPVAVRLPDVSSLVSFPEPEVRLWVSLESGDPAGTVYASIGNVTFTVGKSTQGAADSAAAADEPSD